MEIKPNGEMCKLGVVVSGERVHRPLMDSQLTAEDLEKARVELNETPEVRERLLREFREKLAEEKDFCPQTDDNYLLRFLRTRKFDLERSYKLMRNNYKFRAAHPEWYPRSPIEISDFLNENVYDFPLYRDHMGRAIFYVKLANYDPDKFPHKDITAAGIMMTELMMNNPVTQINGMVGLWDFKGFNWKQFFVLCSPMALWSLKHFMQECQPGRFKVGCIVNSHPLAVKAWNVTKILLKEKFRKRLRMFGPDDLKGLHEFIDPCILPREYGGRMPDWDGKDIVKYMFDKEQYVQYNRSFGYKT